MRKNTTINKKLPLQNNKTAKPKKYTLASITKAFCGLTMTGILILTIVSAIQVDGLLREELRIRIGDVVNMMAQKVDGDLHSQVRTVNDDKSAAFIKLKNDLVAMRQHGTEIANAYTMRILDNGETAFIVDGSEKDQNATGDIYPKESTSKAFTSAFNATPDKVAVYVEPEIYTDDWGTWLSAYAPIFTSSGKLDGIVGIDVSAKSIREHEIKYLITIMIASILVVILTLPFVFRLMNFIRTMTTELEQANQNFRRLLDNSGQGFLSFGANLLIDNEYSRACEMMLGEIPVGKNATDLFFPTDKSKADLFSLIIASVLNETEESVRENMLSLLPAEIQYGERVLKTEYKMLEHNKFMVILTDITQERHIATMLEKERQHLELIVMAVSDSRNFFDIIDGFRVFLAQLPSELLKKIPPHNLTKELYREIHTYKGLLNQFSFPNTPKVLHNIESDLSNLLALGNTLKSSQIAAAISPSVLQISFDEDLAILTDALGEDFFINGERIFLTCIQALQIEKWAKQLLRGETIDTSAKEIRIFLNDISVLRKVSFESVLMGFDGLVRQTAKKMEKEVVPVMVINVENVAIDLRTYQPFLRSLIHVFRNAVVHGIESPEERWEVDKEPVGMITCHIFQEQNAIKLTIADDGAGINLNLLRERVVAEGIHTVDEIASVSDDDMMQFIFMDTISTLCEVTELAGRGVGLSAVLNETHNLGGEVKVKTVIGQGTEFLFTLPLIMKKNLE
ncbi:MAG: ATP-binding protein [Methylococcaceae bacterium]